MSATPKRPRGANRQNKGEADTAAEVAEDMAEAMAEAAADGENPIDQVRNILFGAEIRQQKEETTRLERELRRALDKLADDTGKRFTDLTALLQEQVSLLQQNLHGESAARKDEDRRIEDLLRQLTDDLDTRTDKALADLGASLTREVERLTQHIERRSDELTARLDEARAALERSKADRTLVASVLKTAAAELERGD